MESRFSASGFPGLTVLLTVEDPVWGDLVPDSQKRVAEALGAAARGAGLAADYDGEIGVTLTDDAEVQALNAEWRGKDKPTNILSFPLVQISPGDKPGPLLGDLILARQTLEREAVRDGKTVSDHFSHLLVHGLLHLLGYDHETDEEAGQMERLEIFVLSGLAIADPYADSDGHAGEEPAH